MILVVLERITNVKSVVCACLKLREKIMKRRNMPWSHVNIVLSLRPSSNTKITKPIVLSNQNVVHIVIKRSSLLTGMTIWKCAVSKLISAQFVMDGLRIKTKLRILVVKDASAIKIEPRRRRMINRKQSWSDFSRKDKKKLNKRRNWKNVNKQRKHWDKRRKQKEKSTWNKLTVSMSLMNSKESIDILPITVNLYLPITTSPICHLSKGKTILELLKCQILHPILPNESMRSEATLINPWQLMELVIETD